MLLINVMPAFEIDKHVLDQGSEVQVAIILVMLVINVAYVLYCQTSSLVCVLLGV
jgi:hypothetical protein